MKRLTVEAAERLAIKFRNESQLSRTEPISLYGVLLNKGILTVFKPMSANACGLSTMSRDKKHRYILINSSRSLGRQRFTIAHELYHLYYDKNPEPHMCFEGNGTKSAKEADADMFASALLMPSDGLIACIPNEELRAGRISLATVMRLEQVYCVSHQAMCYRLKRLKLISEAQLQGLLDISVARTAQSFGYSPRIYDDGDGRKEVVGDFIAKARVLLDAEKISEGHYQELNNLIADGEG